MDAVPAGIDPNAVEDYLAKLEGVTAVHDLHIWAMSTTEVALTAHLVMDQTPRDDLFLNHVSDALSDRFGIGHATIQIECGHCEHDCRQAPANVV
jgi:cobalt-zinc-cadmium efflux system protein